MYERHSLGGGSFLGRDLLADLPDISHIRPSFDGTFLGTSVAVVEDYMGTESADGYLLTVRSIRYCHTYSNVILAVIGYCHTYSNVTLPVIGYRHTYRNVTLAVIGYRYNCGIVTLAVIGCNRYSSQAM